MSATIETTAVNQIIDLNSHLYSNFSKLIRKNNSCNILF